MVADNDADGDVHFPPEDMADDMDPVDMVSGDVDCENCVHSDVCQLYAAMRRNVAEYEADRQTEAPVEAGVLAVRCDLFAPDE